jgi:putative ABC transport system permease protein
MIPVIIVVCIGTYLLFTQASVYLIRRLKKKETFFWHKTNMLLFSDLSFRMKDNARTFFMVAMVSTVAFSAIGTLFGFQSFTTENTKILNPNTLTYHVNDNEEKNVARINEILKEENVKADHAQTVLRYYEIGNDQIVIAKQSDFNLFADLIGEDTIKVENGQVLVVEFEGSVFGQTGELLKEAIELNSGVRLLPDEVIYSRALPATDSYYVVSDADYKELPISAREQGFHAWQATDGKDGVFKASEKLYKELPPNEISSGEYEVYLINKNYAPILFVGLFIGIVFFVSAGSFLYFRLYMDLDEDKQKFKSIAKMGLSENELKKVLNRQTGILFFAPIGIALIHGAVALTALSHLFFYNLFKESVIVLSVFLVIQVIYFFIVRHFYTKQIKSVI